MSIALRQLPRRVPLLPTLIDRTSDLGVVGLRCRVSLQVQRAERKGTVPISFVVDSGASYSFVSHEFARTRQIAMDLSGPEFELPSTTAYGMARFRVRPGRIRAWWHEDLGGHPFDWPVLFQLNAPPSVPSILGLGGVVKTCRWTVDGQVFAESPHGYLSLEDTR